MLLVHRSSLRAIRHAGALGLFASLCLQTAALAVVPDRVTGPVRANRIAVIHGSVHPAVEEAADNGPLDAAAPLTGMRLLVKLSRAQQAELDKLLEDQRDPASPDYQRWLTPEEYGARFGASDNDLAAISDWLTSHGLTVDGTARARNWITFSGAARDVAAAFRTELRQYTTGTEQHFANATEIAIPEVFAAVVDSVRGLDDFRPAPQRTARLVPDFTSSNSQHYLAPDDIAAIYDIAPLYAAGYDGTGQKLVIAGQTGINLADIRAFRAQFGLPAKDPQVVLDGPDPGVSPNDQIEADLDLEWAGAVARNATVIYVNSRNVFTSVQYAVDQRLAPVISLSYGACESGMPASFRALAQQANAQGMTWMTSSGDSGAAACDYGVKVASKGLAVSFPADIPEVTAVGGTEFAEAAGTGWNNRNSATQASASGWLPERAWNDSALGGGLAATGGGVSTLFPKPWWQTGPGVPNDNARDLPDISLSASADHDGYLLYAGGKLQAVGGTSASSPVFAGIVTLLNQYLVARGTLAVAGTGNINPTLYSLAQNSAAAGVFHDITLGDNIVPCSTNSPGCTSGSYGYKAGAGYDLVTGLGSVDANNLITKWSAASAQVGTSMTLTANPLTMLQTVSAQLTATVKAVSGKNAPTGSVSFSLGGTMLGSAALVAGSAASVAMLTVKGTSLAVGNNTISASYSPAGGFTASAATAALTVNAPAVTTSLTLIASPVQIAATGSTSITLTLKPASGSVAPSGSIVVTLGKTVLGTVTLAASGSAAGGASATGTLTVKGSSLATGANLISAAWAGSSAFAASTGSVSVTVAAPPVATGATMTASPTNIAATGSTVLTAIVKPASGTLQPTGNVTFQSGSVTLGTAALTATAGVATATLTVKATSLATGTNTITAAWAGSAGLAASTGTVTVTVAPAAPAVASVALSAARGSSSQTGFPVTLQVQEQAGTATSLAGLTINGTSFTSMLKAVFGSTQLPAHGKLTGSMVVQWSPLPATLTFVVSGVDSTGHQWSQTTSVATNK